MEALDAEDRALLEGGNRLGHGGTLPFSVRQHHADLVTHRYDSPATRRAFDEHREAHRQEALARKADRTK